MIFFWISLSLIIFQYRFINLRVYLYANLSDVDSFKTQFRQSRLVFLLALVVVLCIHLIFIYMEIFARNDLMQEINIMAFLLESVALLTSFLIYGVTLIMDIRKYYEKRYSAQRICVIKQVIAVSIAIVVLQIKLAIEYFFCADGFCHGFGTGHFPQVTIWV